MTRRGFNGSFSSGDETQRFGRGPGVEAGTAEAPDSESLGDARFAPGTVLAGRYRLVAMLGRGGMGEVYRAEDLKLSEPVALKFLPEELNFDAKALDRFHREVRVARQITHRNVCRVYDIGEAEGAHFLTMEYIDGEDLSVLLRRIGRLPQDKAGQLARQVCRGLAAAHDAGVLHRDLKPANVMVDGEGQAKITDFGLARLLDELRQSASNQFIGTPAYMAPEQIRGDKCTERSDLFSLGMVLYEMFTGRRAFPDESWIQLLARGGREASPTKPARHVDGLDPEIESVLLRCLEQDEKDRPASAFEVLASLPGGDLLRAALEAGETPSPEMVAGAVEGKTMARWQAATLLALFALALVTFHLTASRTTLLGMVEPRLPPEMLENRARTLLYDLGWSVAEDPGSDWYGTFRFEEGRIDECEATTASEWRERVMQRPALITYYFRTSDSSLFDPRADVPAPSIPEPEAGDALVKLDTRGRLELLRIDPRPGPASEGSPEWRRLLSWADLGAGDLTELPTPPLNTTGYDLPVHDTRRAWVARSDGANLRIDAASFGALPVFFSLGQAPEPHRVGETVVDNRILVAYFAVLLLAGFVAVRNYHLARWDAHGALAIATTVAGLSLLAALSRDGGDLGWVDVYFLADLTSTVAYRGFVVVILYMAMEPAVRAWAPDLIISWTRLVRGRWRNVRVGRDVLIGLAIGAAGTTPILYLSRLWDPVPLVTMELSSKLHGIGPSLGLVGQHLFIAVTGAFAVALLLSIFERWLKKRWVTAAVMAVVVAILAQTPVAALLPLTVAFAGVLTGIVAWLAFGYTVINPATADPSLWWAWPEAWLMSVLLLIVGVVAYRQAIGLGTAVRRTI